MTTMPRKMNGVKMELSYVEEASQDKRYGVKKHAVNYYNLAAVAIERAYQHTNGFHGYSASNIVTLIDAALQDDFVPLRRRMVKQKGNRFKRALDKIRITNGSLQLPHHQ